MQQIAHHIRRGGRFRLVPLIPSLAATLALTLAPVTPVAAAVPAYEVTEIEDLAYGPAVPGNLLDLYLPVCRAPPSCRS